jgi:uncharacterized protein (TIGR03086 family)
MTDTWEVLEQAHAALHSVVARLTPADLDKSTPCDQWNVAQVIQHAAGDQRAYAVAITGQDGPSYNPFEPSGVLAESAVELVASATAASSAAWSTIGKDVEDAPVPLPQGPLPAWQGVGYCALDAVVHAWDVAVATGQDSPLTNEHAKALMPAAVALTEPLRAYGMFAAVVDAEEGDDDAAVLLKYLGRRSDWKV